MKTNWQTKKLEDVLKYEQPSKYIVKSTKYCDDYEIPVLTAGKSFILGKTKEKNGIFPQEKLPVIIFDDFTTASKFVDFPFKVKSSAMKILHPVQNISDARFLYYFMQNINFDYTGIHKRYWISEYSNIEILLPPLSEQKRITKVLDEVFEKVQKTKENIEKNLQNSKTLFETSLKSIFDSSGDGWEKKKIIDVCELKSGTTISPLLERLKGNVLYTKIADMNLPGNLVEINTSSRFVNSNEIKMNQIIPEGAVIFPKRGGAIATNKKRKIIKPTIVDLNTMAIIPGKKIDKNYFYHWFQLIDLNDISNGTSIPQINNYSFNEIYISYPISLNKQKTIVKKLDELSNKTKKLEVIYKKKLAYLEEFKKSILEKAFTGML